MMSCLFESMFMAGRKVSSIPKDYGPHHGKAMLTPYPELADNEEPAATTTVLPPPPPPPAMPPVEGGITVSSYPWGYPYM